MIELIPNWHPLLVHFTLALVVTAAVFLIVARLFHGRGWAAGLAIAGDWNLWLGALVTIATVFAGFYAYNTVAHDGPSHLAMGDHRNWAVPTALVILVLAAFLAWTRRKGRPAGVVFITVLGLTALSLAVVAYKGAELVYRHGLGVIALPAPEADEGHGHSHKHNHDGAEEPDHDHDHGAAAGAGGDADHDHAAQEEEAGGHHHAPPDSAEATLDAFHHAVTEGDGAAALALLAEDVVIVESGEENPSRADYAAHHLPADIKFSATMTRQVTARKVHAGADMAWILSSTRTTGTYKGRTIDSMGKETVVLERRGGKWLIVHLHSSVARKRKE